MTSAAPSIRIGDDLPVPCPGCRYDLRHTPGDRCPECGRIIDPDTRAGRTTIPWQVARREARRWPRRFAAFWRTAWASTRHPLQLAQQAGRDIDYRSARRFQFWSVTIASLLVAPVLFLIYFQDVRTAIYQQTTFAGFFFGETPRLSAIDYVIESSIATAAGLAGWLWLFLATRVPSYFFQPKSLDRVHQERAVALSYYASGTVVWMALLILFWAGFFKVMVGFLYFDYAPQWSRMAFAAIATGSIGLLLVLVWAVPGVLLGAGIGGSAGRIAALLFTTALAWPLLLIACLAVLPFTLSYLFYLFYLLSW